MATNEFEEWGGPTPHSGIYSYKFNILPLTHTHKLHAHARCNVHPLEEVVEYCWALYEVVFLLDAKISSLMYPPDAIAKCNIPEGRGS